MQCTLYEKEDAIHITVGNGTSSKTRQLDESRYLGLNEDGELVWVSLLNVSEGVDLEDIFTNQDDYATASRFLDDNGVKVLV
jgi:hypothetical protein